MGVADEDDFEGYVASRWSALIRSAIYLGCTPDQAEDLVQSTLIHCYRSWSRVSRADRVDAYVHRVLVRTHMKNRKRRWHGEVPTATPMDAITSDGGAVGTDVSDARADLRRALSGLSVDHRTVLVLRFVADLTEPMTAEVLGVPVGTVKSRVARALAAIDRASLLEGTP